MPLAAIIANALWSASNVPAWHRFRRAIWEPESVQRRKLRWLLRQNEATAFGRAHGFQRIGSYEKFADCVPLSDYQSLEPWIERVRQGEKNVLTHEEVTHVIPTSGTTGGRKLIPFTAGLHREFNAAIGAWLVDLARQNPSLLGGRAYWSITPRLEGEPEEKSAVPVGFDADTSYLGGGRRALAQAVMAVPDCAGRAKSLEAFRYQTLLRLICCRDLRLISVWHPSFLTLLLDALPELWDRLIHEVEKGAVACSNPKRRAKELCAADPLKPETIWPHLTVISCWGTGAAANAMEDLRRRFPGVHFQPKGLIATEAFVTLPFQRKYPLAVASHFFEFIDADGRIFPVEGLVEGGEYELVVTTAGGLWRYRLGDRVRVAGTVGNTPSLEFLGRDGNVSDRFGEKLSEMFVMDALHEVFGPSAPRFAMVAPEEDELGWRYTLYVEGNAHLEWPEMLERALRKNPHYAYCRDLGQLQPLRVFVISERGFETFARWQAASGARLGDIKPVALCKTSGWSKIFGPVAAQAA